MPGVYTNTIITGASNTFRLVITNWTELRVRHFFAVRASVNGQTSIYSNEIHWPPYDPDHVELRWAGAASNLLVSANVYGPWARVPVGGTNAYMEAIANKRFFRLEPPMPLTIRAFNPRNYSGQ